MCFESASLFMETKYTWNAILNAMQHFVSYILISIPYENVPKVCVRVVKYIP